MKKMVVMKKGRLIDFEIYWRDLTFEARQRLIAQGFEDDENINLAPLAIISQQKAEKE